MNGRVSVDNDFFKFLVPQQKVITNPKKIVFFLFSKRNERSEARVDKKKIATDERKLQCFKKFTVGISQHAVQTMSQPDLFKGSGIYRGLYSK